MTKETLPRNCPDCGCYGAHFCVGKKPEKYSLTEAPPLGPECVVCGNHIVGTMVGAGDGAGREFAHDSCASRRIIYNRVSMTPLQVVQFSRVSDPSKWEDSWHGIPCGHPAIARFAARWLNKVLDWWRNW